MHLPSRLFPVLAAVSGGADTGEDGEERKMKDRSDHAVVSALGTV